MASSSASVEPKEEAKPRMPDLTGDDVILAPELKAALKFLNAPLSDDEERKTPPYVHLHRNKVNADVFRYKLRECETSRPSYSR